MDENLRALNTISEEDVAIVAAILNAASRHDLTIVGRHNENLARAIVGGLAMQGLSIQSKKKGTAEDRACAVITRGMKDWLPAIRDDSARGITPRAVASSIVIDLLNEGFDITERKAFRDGPANSPTAANTEAETYAYAPMTITEARAHRAHINDQGGAADWTPRDVLVKMLRDIDSGERPMPQVLVICHGTEAPDGVWKAGFAAASPHYAMTLGTLSSVMMRIGMT